MVGSVKTRIREEYEEEGVYRVRNRMRFESQETRKMRIPIIK